MRIVIVDDELPVREMLKQQLMRLGHEVKLFASADEVFHASEQELSGFNVGIIDGLNRKAPAVEDWITHFSPNCTTFCFSTEVQEGFRGRFVQKPFLGELLVDINKGST